VQGGLRDPAAFAFANQAESLLALGQWDEAGQLAARGRADTKHALYLGWAATTVGALAVLRGDLDTAAAELNAARCAFGCDDRQPQNTIPLRHLAAAVAAGSGRFLQARAEVEQALDEGFAPGMHRYAWPLLHTATVIEADAVGLPAADAGRPAVLAAIREAAGKLPALAPVWAAYALLVDAELGRADLRSDTARWAAAEAAFAALDRPYQLARIRLRLAEAHLAEGDREAAAPLLAAAHATAGRLGATPLRAETAQLADRARLPLNTPAGTAPAAAAEPFGLTTREREVLRRVAAGYTNRRIAEELFISPKTASVHVSNILAKLGVTGRGEAAALAHRLRLFAGA
jgi:DNA-binding CsgD family transcriptional regulator